MEVRDRTCWPIPVTGGHYLIFNGIYLWCETAYSNEICGLLGYYATSCGNYLPTFRDNIIVLLTREDGTDTLSRNDGKQLPHNANAPEDRRFHQHRDGRLKSKVTVTSSHFWCTGCSDFVIYFASNDYAHCRCAPIIFPSGRRVGGADPKAIYNYVWF